MFRMILYEILEIRNLNIVTVVGYTRIDIAIRAAYAVTWLRMARRRSSAGRAGRSLTLGRSLNHLGRSWIGQLRRSCLGGSSLKPLGRVVNDEVVHTLLNNLGNGTRDTRGPGHDRINIHVRRINHMLAHLSIKNFPRQTSGKVPLRQRLREARKLLRVVESRRLTKMGRMSPNRQLGGEGTSHNHLTSVRNRLLGDPGRHHRHRRRGRNRDAYNRGVWHLRRWASLSFRAGRGTRLVCR